MIGRTKALRKLVLDSSMESVSNHVKRLRELRCSDKKSRGYSGRSPRFVDPCLPRVRMLRFRHGPYLTIDRYTGQEQNIGQAITYFARRPVYGFNYYGRMVSRTVSAERTFRFLKRALRAGAGRCAYRGPSEFRQQSWSYSNTFHEDGECVRGEERIYWQNKLVYWQVYHGGPIEDSRSYLEWQRGVRWTRGSPASNETEDVGEKNGE